MKPRDWLLLAIPTAAALYLLAGMARADRLWFRDDANPAGVVSGYEVVVESATYPLTGVTVAADGTRSGTFGPVILRLRAVGAGGLKSAASAESVVAVAALRCRADLDGDTAVGLRDVATTLGMSRAMLTCQ